MDDEVRTPAEVARARVAALAEDFERRQAPPGAHLAEPDEQEDHRPRFRLALEAPQLRVAGALLVAAVIAALWWTRGPETTQAASDTPSVIVDAEELADEVVVHVGGEVVEPGIVTLPAGSRVVDAVEAAGGLDGDVDTEALNLARPLIDGEQILVGIEPPAGETGDAATDGGLISLNQASTEQLQSLPGVGPVTAEAIVRWREENGGFTQVDDLLEVRGIGEARLAELRDLVTP